MTQEQEQAKRDEALDLLERYRAQLIEEAKKRAYQIASRVGYVTSPMVLADLRESPQWAPIVEQADSRFMGAVFRKGWTRVGWDGTGSHKRPVARWQYTGEGARRPSLGSMETAVSELRMLYRRTGVRPGREVLALMEWVKAGAP